MSNRIDPVVRIRHLELEKSDSGVKCQRAARRIGINYSKVAEKYSPSMLGVCEIKQMNQVSNSLLNCDFDMGIRIMVNY